MGMEGSVFGCRRRKIRSVHGHAAQMDEFSNVTAHAVGLSNRLEHTSRPGDIDAPHAIAIKDSSPQRIKHECEMNDALHFLLNQQRGELATGGLVAKIKLIESISRRHER